ncbi:extracellular solute-binding protein [Demequina oxidasica]|uniref:extracellular solute-binding protein n=1 Tax=Demequina oxidasica TaxID=676199 RepID=UPI0007826A5A|nr:extracellular solute-binding protein [Demequina oxidasica]
MELGAGHSWHDPRGALDIDSSKAAFDLALGTIEADQSAGAQQWSDEWNTGIADGTFAVMLCPIWMLDYIEGVSAGSDEEVVWDIADLPGPGGNAGGSFLAIPDQFDDATTTAAYDFVEWLIQPEQQLRVLHDTGQIPSRPALYDDANIKEMTNPAFSDAPTGEIFSQAVTEMPEVRPGTPEDAEITAAVVSVLREVQAGNIEVSDAWQKASNAATTIQGSD